MLVGIRFIPVGIFCALCMVAQASDRAAAAPGGDARGSSAASIASEPLSIRVVAGDWGSASREEIERLLVAVARELWIYFPERRLKPILVIPTDHHPLARYAKGPNGEYVVYLSAKGRHWSQYAYQFAHEFAHILSNYDRNGHHPVQRNQWFDESLCETASLFALRRLGATWLRGETVPYPHWRNYGSVLQGYARDLLAQPHRAAPSSNVLAEWYRGAGQKPQSSPFLREREEAVAGMLLPLFEQNPEAWMAISYLNLDESDASGSFEQYLANWHRNTPEQHRPLVERIIELFGFPPRGR